MPVKRLQRHLEGIYGVPVSHDVEDFLITDAALARQLDTSENAREVKEKLLVRQTDEDLELTLYLDSEVVENLKKIDPERCLDDSNLEDFLIALEGVSHFLYVIWNANFCKPVTLFELEMQAEVDKYVTSKLFSLQQPHGINPAALRTRLFGEPSFDQALSDDELERYRSANHYAGRYCDQLENRYEVNFGGAAMLEELRRFYRLSQGDKVSRINAS